MALQGALGKRAAGAERAVGRPLGGRTGFSAAPSIAPRGRQQLEQLTARFNRNPSPPDAPKDRTPVGREWLETILSRFGPTKERAQNVTTLDFEKPLVELDNRIKEVGDWVERYLHCRGGRAFSCSLPAHRNPSPR